MFLRYVCSHLFPRWYEVAPPQPSFQTRAAVCILEIAPVITAAACVLASATAPSLGGPLRQHRLSPATQSSLGISCRALWGIRTAYVFPTLQSCFLIGGLHSMRLLKTIKARNAGSRYGCSIYVHLRRFSHCLLQE